MRGLILGLDFLEPKRLRKKLLMDSLSKRMRANTLNYQKPILILKAFDLKSKKISLFTLNYQSSQTAKSDKSSKFNKSE